MGESKHGKSDSKGKGAKSHDKTSAGGKKSGKAQDYKWFFLILVLILVVGLGIAWKTGLLKEAAA